MTWPGHLSGNIFYRCCLPEGHQIGQPGPLIREIKAEEITALKEKFAGNQESRSKASSPPKAVIIDKDNVKKLELEVKAQGDFVRNLKASKADKATIADAVEKLKSLKLDLTIAEGKDPSQNAGGGNKKGKKK